MKTFKGGIDYEERILIEQEKDECPSVHPHLSPKPDKTAVMDLTDDRTVKEMITESKYYLLGLIVRKQNS